MHNFKELNVWQEAVTLCKQVFVITKQFPDEEKYGLKSQIRRCCVSIPSNIAEGCGRESSKEFNQFLSIAVGSCFELETQLILAVDFEYISTSQFQEITEKLQKIQKMLNKLKQSIQQKY